jgi:hypothetical protein
MWGRTDISRGLVQGRALKSRSSHVKDAGSSPITASLRFVACALGSTCGVIDILAVAQLQIRAGTAEASISTSDSGPV